RFSQVRGNAARILARREAKRARKIVGQDHAYGNALTMEQAVGIACVLFECVPKGVAEIEEGPDADFFFVLDDDAGLMGAAAGDGFATGRAASKDFGVVGFEPFKEV